MATPASVLAQINTTPWANSRGLVTGPQMQALLTGIVGLFGGSGSLASLHQAIYTAFAAASPPLAFQDFLTGYVSEQGNPDGTYAAVFLDPAPAIGGTFYNLLQAFLVARGYSSGAAASLLTSLWVTGPSFTAAPSSVAANDVAFPDDFGAVGNNIADDTVAMLAFFTHANNNPGLEHRLRKTRYKISAPLPNITNGGAWISGVRSFIHNSGPTLSGSVISWAGPPGATMLTLQGQHGVGLQNLCGVKLDGVGFDCNGVASVGVHCQSVTDSEIDLAVANATYVGLWLDVVAGANDQDILDTQHNRIRFAGNQLGVTAGDAASHATSVYMSGSETANVSLNKFDFTIVHNHGPAVIAKNNDNNKWWLDTYAAGDATESVSMLGGATSVNLARSERFEFVTGNKPIHVYGTGGAVPYAFPSIDNVAFLDKGNNTPDPVWEAGGQISFYRSNADAGDAPPVTFTPVASVLTGGIVAPTVGGYYLKRNGYVDVELNISGATITGSPAAVLMTIPFTLGGIVSTVFHGNDFATGKQVKGGLLPGTNVVSIQNYDGSCPASGMNIVLNGRFRIY